MEIKWSFGRNWNKRNTDHDFPLPFMWAENNKADNEFKVRVRPLTPLHPPPLRLANSSAVWGTYLLNDSLPPQIAY